MNTIIGKAALLDWAKMTGDVWLVAEIAQRKIETDWDAVVAAGCITIHAESPDPSDTFRRLIRGEVIEHMVVGRRWFRSLDEASVIAVEIEACVKMAEIAVKVINGGFDFLALCRERDDIDGVAVLLRDRGEAHRVDSALEALDAFVADKVDMIHFATDDVRLRRALLCNPYAWWGC